MRMVESFAHRHSPVRPIRPHRVRREDSAARSTTLPLRMDEARLDVTSERWCRRSDRS